MAKADPKKDYYADLDLSKDADLLEIKKQFKKLALKYHPDRNPGHEDEFNARFQAIQCAHEVLTDPVQKAKYDADRSRLSSGYGGAGFRPNVPSRNPYAAYSNFPPPPRPPPPRSTTTTFASASQNAQGANRYSAYAKSHGSARPKEDPNARTNAYRAWENWNRSTNHARPTPNPAPFPPPPRSNRMNEPASYATGNAQQSTTPQPGSVPDPFNHLKPGSPSVSRSQSARVTRRPGFAPATPQAYPSSGHAVPRRPVPPPAGGIPDPLSQFRAQNPAFDRPDSPRLSTPYATKGGEKTYLSSSTLKRSTTFRDPARSSPSERPRSASPLRNRDHPPRRPPDQKSRTGPPTPSGSPSKGARLDADDSPPRQRRGHSHHGGSRFDHYVPSDTSSDEQKESGYESPTFMDRLASEGRARGRRRARPRHYQYPTYQSPNGQMSGVATGPPKDQADGGGPPRASEQRDTESSARDPQATNARRKSLGIEGERGGRQTSTFTFAVNDHMFVPQSAAASSVRNNSTENINTRFSPADWPGQFNSNAPDYFQPQPASKRKVKSPPAADAPGVGAAAGGSPVRSQQQSTTANDEVKINGESSQTSNRNPLRSAVPDGESFQPEYWAEQLKQHSWDPPAHPPVSPIRGTTMSGKRSEPRVTTYKAANISGTTRRPTIPKPASVSVTSETSDGRESSLESTATHSRSAGSPTESAVSDGGAMDIDPKTPPAGRREDGIAAGPNTSVVNDRGPLQQRREGAGDVSFGRGRSQSGKDDLLSGRPGSGLPNLSLKDPPVRSTSRRVGLDDHTSSTWHFGHLKKVEPLVEAPSGLKDMHDLSSTLPFESRAAAHASPIKNLEPQRLELPNPPKALATPAKLSQNEWEKYLATMQVYMYEWTQFIDLMLAHFNDRQQETKEQLTPNWMGILGEGPKGGYLKYMQGVEEDFRVREHLDVAWEKHREAMWAFGRVRSMAIERALQSA